MSSGIQLFYLIRLEFNSWIAHFFPSVLSAACPAPRTALRRPRTLKWGTGCSEGQQGHTQTDSPDKV